MKYRKEKDSLGELSVPKKAYFGVHSTRSLQNFKISNLRWHPELIKAIVQLKLACCRANIDLGLLDGKKARAIQKASYDILRGKFTDQFPLDIFQAGSGTSTNMNVNEVLGNRASEILGKKKGSKFVHPNDDVNKGQSTNNVIPSSIRVAALTLLPGLVDELGKLQKAFHSKANEFDPVLKSGRTHLQDAVPMTLGQEFNAYSSALKKHIQRLHDTKKFIRVLGIGGNAVGTGLNTSPRFRGLIIKHLKKEMKLGFQVSKNGIESTQFLTDMASLSSILKNTALDINKIANDLRLLSSGPKTGLNEIILPAVEPGSSIMPGKINPSICEAVNMACYQIIGNDQTISLSCAAGNLDLNTHMPVIGHNLIESMKILRNSAKTFAEKCVQGIKANKEQCQWYVENSMALATALNPYLGYDTAAALVKESLKSQKTIKQLVLEKGLMKKDELDKVLDPKKLTKPNLK
ncbi:aspartate ammonia-lyase [Candidatus Woesearchaeota archaeon]|nr:aspartate ammonia-lyase [Candidatus Woesearchaeota archaeon]